MFNSLDTDYIGLIKSIDEYTAESMYDTYYYSYKATKFVTDMMNKYPKFTNTEGARPKEFKTYDTKRSMAFYLPFMYFAEDGTTIKLGGSPDRKIDPDALDDKQKLALEKELLDLDNALKGKNNNRLERLKKEVLEAKMQMSDFISHADFTKQENIQKLNYCCNFKQSLFHNLGYNNPEIFHRESDGTTSDYGKYFLRWEFTLNNAELLFARATAKRLNTQAMSLVQAHAKFETFDSYKSAVAENKLNEKGYLSKEDYIKYIAEPCKASYDMSETFDETYMSSITGISRLYMDDTTRTNDDKFTGFLYVKRATGEDGFSLDRAIELVKQEMEKYPDNPFKNYEYSHTLKCIESYLTEGNKLSDADKEIISREVSAVSVLAEEEGIKLAERREITKFKKDEIIATEYQKIMKERSFIADVGAEFREMRDKKREDERDERNITNRSYIRELTGLFDNIEGTVDPDNIDLLKQIKQEVNSHKLGLFSSIIYGLRDERKAQQEFIKRLDREILRTEAKKDPNSKSARKYNDLRKKEMADTAKKLNTQRAPELTNEQRLNLRINDKACTEYSALNIAGQGLGNDRVKEGLGLIIESHGHLFFDSKNNKQRRNQILKDNAQFMATGASSQDMRLMGDVAAYLSYMKSGKTTNQFEEGEWEKLFAKEYSDISLSIVAGKNSNGKGYAVDRYIDQVFDFIDNFDPEKMHARTEEELVSFIFATKLSHGIEDFYHRNYTRLCEKYSTDAERIAHEAKARNMVCWAKDFQKNDLETCSKYLNAISDAELKSIKGLARPDAPEGEELEKINNSPYKNRKNVPSLGITYQVSKQMSSNSIVKFPINDAVKAHAEWFANFVKGNDYKPGDREYNQDLSAISLELNDMFGVNQPYAMKVNGISQIKWYEKIYVAGIPFKEFVEANIASDKEYDKTNKFTPVDYTAFFLHVMANTPLPVAYADVQLKDEFPTLSFKTIGRTDRRLHGYVSGEVETPDKYKDINDANVNSNEKIMEALSLHAENAFYPKFTQEAIEAYNRTVDSGMEQKESDIAKLRKAWKDKEWNGKKMTDEDIDKCIEEKFKSNEPVVEEAPKEAPKQVKDDKDLEDVYDLSDLFDEEKQTEVVNEEVNVDNSRRRISVPEASNSNQNKAPKQDIESKGPMNQEKLP